MILESISLIQERKRTLKIVSGGQANRQGPIHENAGTTWDNTIHTHSSNAISGAMRSRKSGISSLG
jgi:hypothetical protein